MPDLGIKNEKDKSGLDQPINTAESSDGIRYPTFSLYDEFEKKADIPKDISVGDEVTITMKVRLSRRTQSEDGENKYSGANVEFKILSIDFEGGSQSEQDAEDKEEEVLGFKREKSSVKKPSAKDLE